MTRHPAIVREDRIPVRDGQLVEGPSWVYVWSRCESPFTPLYVGATGLPPVERTRLHLENADPAIGRVRAQAPDALIGDVVVHAYQLAAGLDRQAVKRALRAQLGGTPTDGPDPQPGAVAAAQEIVGRLRS